VETIKRQTGLRVAVWPQGPKSHVPIDCMPAQSVTYSAAAAAVFACVAIYYVLCLLPIPVVHSCVLSPVTIEITYE